MQLIIDIDSIKDTSTKDWLIQTLKLMNIKYNTEERRQSLEEYNRDIEEAEEEIERGDFITAEELKKEARSS
jgi:hypothetical protein